MGRADSAETGSSPMHGAVFGDAGAVGNLFGALVARYRRAAPSLRWGVRAAAICGSSDPSMRQSYRATQVDIAPFMF
jgi:hypothetical protein